MPLIVQKFGGTSVADPVKILAAARKAIRAQNEGNQVVVVVSAMGHHTDELIELAKQVNEKPSAREMDMLLATGEQVSVSLMAMAIASLGYDAVSLTGAQLGIRTDSSHGKARIKSIDDRRVRECLDAGNIVIAAGFQGIDENFNITTLGRGGSDTTAVALAAALHADACEIYTDVDGVYTTDPRALPEARRTVQVSYDEMLELASLGAGVMHNRAVEFGKKYRVPIHVRSSFSDITGTMIVDRPESEKRTVSGAAITRNEARITLYDLPDVPGTLYTIFDRLFEAGLTIDMIVQDIGEKGLADISFTVPRDELDDALDTVNEVAEEVGISLISHDADVSKISVVGLGMAQASGVADRMFRALSDAGINIQMITTSEIKISVLVQRDQAQDALRAVHEAFQLDETPDDAPEEATIPPLANGADLDEILKRLRLDMEGLTIYDISLDSSQGRVTIDGVPHTPGVAADIFDELARDDIFIDMIVQSHIEDDKTCLSFTIPSEEYDDAWNVAKKLVDKNLCREVDGARQVAKLSVSGIGLHSHTEVAERMFRALGEAGINIQMVSTSEVRVNVVVDGSQGEQALKLLKEAFADVMPK